MSLPAPTVEITGTQRVGVCADAETRLSLYVERRLRSFDPPRRGAPLVFGGRLAVDLNQVTVPSSDVRRSIDFYRTLGLHLIVESLPEYARFECPDGHATLSVEQKPGPFAENSIVVYFECANLDAVVSGLKRSGLSMDSDPKDQPWLWREARLRDPDGNVICLFTAGQNRKYPPWRLET